MPWLGCCVWGCGVCVGGQPFAASGRARVAEVVWNRLPEWVRVPYVKCVCGLVRGVPE